MSNSKHPKLEPFLFHGVDLTPDPTEAVGNCPFCDKSRKFYVETATGLWDCKVCGEQGNITTFLRHL